MTGASYSGYYLYSADTGSSWPTVVGSLAQMLEVYGGAGGSGMVCLAEGNWGW